jgi:hypothetical protein
LLLHCSCTAPALLLLSVSPAGNDFDPRNESYAANFEKVEYVHDKCPKEYLIAFKVKKGSRAAGQDVSANGLDGINGLYIAAVDRPSTQEHFSNVGGGFVLQVSLLGQYSRTLLHCCIYARSTMSGVQLRK